MSKYFTKYLPVDGDIKVGDKIRSESSSKHAVTVTTIDEDGDYVTDELDFHEYMDRSYFVVRKNKAVKIDNKLFLCSKNIQVGDNAFYNIGYKTEPKSIEDECDLDFIHRSDGYKVIGEISPDALSYVKEGQEYDESEVGILYNFIGEDSENTLYSIDVFWKEAKRWYRNYIPDYIKPDIAIKGPCGHFH